MINTIIGFDKIKHDKNKLLIKLNLLSRFDDHEKSKASTLLVSCNYLHKHGININVEYINMIYGFTNDRIDMNIDITEYIEDNIYNIFNQYLYYFSCQKDDFQYIGGALMTLTNPLINTTIHVDLLGDLFTFVDNYMNFHKFIIQKVKSLIIIDQNKYSTFSYAILKDPNHEYTDQLVDILINNKYIITYKDIGLAKLIMYDFIHDVIVINEIIIFFNIINLLKDLKIIICNYLIHLILQETQTNYYKVYNKLINYYYC